MPAVSVIIPTYNRGVFLANAIESVLAQSQRDFEVWVVDDASDSQTQSGIVASFGDSRLQYVRLQSHRGPAGARNAGLERARGTWIAFLDDDDEWLQDKLAVQVGILNRSPHHVGGVYSARVTVDRDTGASRITRYAERVFDPRIAGNVITTSSLIVRRECFEVAGVFDETLEASSDYDMWIRIGQHFDFRYVDEPLVKYHVHSDRISTDYSKKARSTERVLDKHRELLSSDSRAYSRQYVALGVLWCLSGNSTRGRHAFRRAVALNPRELRAYSNLILSFFGHALFRRFQQWRRRTARPQAPGP